MKDHWELSENDTWFVKNVLVEKKRPRKKFRLLYEWVEDQIVEIGSILASEVRERAGPIVGTEFGKYTHKQFESLSKRMVKFLNLKSVKIDGMGRKVKWISKE